METVYHFDIKAARSISQHWHDRIASFLSLDLLGLLDHLILGNRPAQCFIHVTVSIAPVKTRGVLQFSNVPIHKILMN